MLKVQFLELHLNLSFRNGNSKRINDDPRLVRFVEGLSNLNDTAAVVDLLQDEISARREEFEITHLARRLANTRTIVDVAIRSSFYL